MLKPETPGIHNPSAQISLLGCALHISLGCTMLPKTPHANN